MDTIKVLRSGTRIVVDPTTSKIHDLLAPQLSYVSREYLQGVSARRAKANGVPPFRDTPYNIFYLDHRGRIGTMFGFYERIRDTLLEAGYAVSLRYATREDRKLAERLNSTVYVPRWENIAEAEARGTKLRYRQREALELFTKYENGRVGCHGGWGKGTLIRLVAQLFPKAKIDVVTRSLDILRQRIYPELAVNLPSVGIICSKQRQLRCQVMCVSAGSLHHARPDADIVLVDEADEACADNFSSGLAVYDRARMWGLSATFDLRNDNKDLRGEAIFGPIRMLVEYQEGVAAGVVCPVEVAWLDSGAAPPGLDDVDDMVEFKRLAYWGNRARNAALAERMRRYDKDTQCLITVDTLEHAFNLKRILPDYELVYAAGAAAADSWDKLEARGIVPDGLTPITQERKDNITRAFERGKLKKVIATTVWNVGVDFRYLQVLARGDGSASPTRDTQIPCRNARKHKDGDEFKPVALVHDMKDAFHHRTHLRAKKRSTSYRINGWRQWNDDGLHIDNRDGSMRTKVCLEGGDR